MPEIRRSDIKGFHPDFLRSVLASVEPDNAPRCRPENQSKQTVESGFKL